MGRAYIIANGLGYIELSRFIASFLNLTLGQINLKDLIHQDLSLDW